MSWEMVIGIEVHVQLATHSKLFSGAATKFGAEPNTQACVIDLGLPGVLPVLNKKAVEHAIKLGLAIDAPICQKTIFDRKNYFYPDLPKGYQISQLEDPIVGLGHLMIQTDAGEKRIGVTRAHLEEDAGKSVHDCFATETGVDLNRAGTPLLEIVSEPDLRSSDEAIAYLKTLHTLVRYLGISDANMQEGSFRADINLSMRPKGQAEFGTRAELKNLNSFRFIEKAIHYEAARQIDILESGGKVVQETRLYDSDKNETRSMRSKEEAQDYRYFPDPDLLPVIISDETIEAIRAEMPELPAAKSARFTEMGLSAEDAAMLIQSMSLSDYFETAANKAGNAKKTANWIIGEVLPKLDETESHIKDCPIPAGSLATLVERTIDGTLSSKTAKVVFSELWAQAGSVDEIIKAKGLKQISDSGELEAIIKDLIEKNPNQTAELKAGKDKLMGFFVGQVMKATQGKANPGEVNRLVKQLLG